MTSYIEKFLANLCIVRSPSYSVARDDIGLCGLALAGSFVIGALATPLPTRQKVPALGLTVGAYPGK